MEWGLLQTLSAVLECLSWTCESPPWHNKLTPSMPRLYTHTNISSCVFRGPGGRGPWPNPNANSVSATSKHFNIAMTGKKSFIISLLPTDSILVFITRKLCGELHAQDFLTLSVCPRWCSLWVILFCARLAGASRRWRPSRNSHHAKPRRSVCFHLIYLNFISAFSYWKFITIVEKWPQWLEISLKRKALVWGNVIWIHPIAEHFPVRL